MAETAVKKVAPSICFKTLLQYLDITVLLLRVFNAHLHFAMYPTRDLQCKAVDICLVYTMCAALRF